jgi:antibiotic biosynthesis monooxygenase (ABM) superfamily enzyme
MSFAGEIDRSASVVITHHVNEDQQAGYEQWLGEIVPISKKYPGHLGVQIIRPISGATATYTIIIRFDTEAHLRAWTGSQDRKRLIGKVRPLLAADDKFYVLSGMDFWFTPQGAKAKLPTRWKQFLVTWSAIYPLVLLVPLFVTPVMRQFGMPDSHYLKTLLVTGVVVFMMVYVVMPRYTQTVHRWLFR